MTDQPPPSGYFPPPPGGYPPPPSLGGYPAPPPGPPALPSEAYTPWLSRVFAWLIDYVPFYLIVGIGLAVLWATRETACVTDISEYDLGEFCATGSSTIGQVSALFIFPVLALVYLVWNLGYRQGVTGCSVGKSIMKFRLISEKTGKPIGFGMSLVRELIYLVFNGACGLPWLIAVLFPLWDAKRQTLVDKILSTVCVPL
ncbi:RDD family protein [Mycobacterium sp. Y57]|uniref:RDD family protein n=1 Tax=Mycolicibacterium xanthum TaxID=2796469 RepID=UPI001C854826|nr:RDD family protein [Mycolicibacterium xanthum]MBX7433529.1 RDD family protein [Mycolicibacterium xanthum]